LPSDNKYNLKLDLAYPIEVEQSFHKILTSKIEIKLKKQDDIRWLVLEGKPVVQYAERSPVGKYIIKSFITFYRRIKYKCQIENLIIALISADKILSFVYLMVFIY
jgi:hypothetical protein